MKRRLARKTKIVLVIVICVAVVGTVVGTLLGVYQPFPIDNAVPTVASLSAEPDYLVTVSWEKVKNAIGYKFQYYYEDDGGLDNVITVSTNSTSYGIPRAKGKLAYRIRTVARYERFDTEYSDWYSYEVAALTLDTPTACTLLQFENGVKIDLTTWQDTTYVYKTNTYTVPYYEYVAVGPDMDAAVQFEYNVVAISVSNLKSNYFNFTKGEWTLYYRAATYVPFYNDKIYAEPLGTLYTESSVWAQTTITVK